MAMCFALCRVEGVKRVTHAAVGEKHSLALQSWCATPLSMRLRSASSGALSSAASGLLDRAASAAVSEGLAGPMEEYELAREQQMHAAEDAEAASYWHSLESLQGPASRWASSSAHSSCSCGCAHLNGAQNLEGTISA